MWTYRRDKYGILEAIREYYPAKMDEPQVAALMAQAESALAMLDRLMSEFDPPKY